MSAASPADAATPLLAVLAVLEGSLPAALVTVRSDDRLACQALALANRRGLRVRSRRPLRHGAVAYAQFAVAGSREALDRLLEADALPRSIERDVELLRATGADENAVAAMLRRRHGGPPTAARERAVAARGAAVDRRLAAHGLDLRTWTTVRTLPGTSAPAAVPEVG